MKKQVMIYDDACPLCSAYTAGFVKMGLLDQEERQCFSSVDPKLLTQIDVQRSRNEIPLLDTITGEVSYGIDALVKLLGEKFSLIKWIAGTPALKFLLYKIYKLISYNRRSIVAAETNQVAFDCTPDFNIKYRLLFMILGLIFNTCMLFPLQHYVLAKSMMNTPTVMQVQLGHTLFVFANIYISARLKARQGFEYAAQINMLALTAILLAMPLIFINRVNNTVPPFINNLYLAGILLFIIKEYLRRMKFAGILYNKTNIVCLNIFCLIIFVIYLTH